MQNRAVKFTIIFILLFAYGALVPFLVFADQKDIVINEIAAYESSDREWIEIYNKRTAPVDITGWKLYEHGTNHAITLYRGSLIIGGGAYAIIANDAKKLASVYPSFMGTLIDSSWQGLSEKGEDIGLKDKGGAVVENFTYIAAPKASLERSDPSKADYTAANWKERASGNSIGMQNSNYHPVVVPSTDRPVTYAVIVPHPSFQKVETIGGEEVVLSEIFPNPKGSDTQEFIELENRGQDAIDISGWSIGSASHPKKYVFPQGVVIAPHTFWTLTKKHFSSLRNDQEKVILFDSSSHDIDHIDYTDAPAGMSLSRRADKLWEWTSQPSPNKQNIFPKQENDTLTSSSPVAAKDVGDKKIDSRSIPINVTQQLHGKPIDSSVRIEAIVSVEPAVLGVNHFYVSDLDIQIWDEKKDFPALHKGDRVSIAGVLKKHGEELALKVKSGNDIHVLGHNQKLVPRSVALKDISHNLVGSFVSSKGSVASIRWPSFHIVDGSSDIRISIEKGTHIANPGFKNGDQVAVQGIVSETASGVRILPRDAHDITLIPPSLKKDNSAEYSRPQPYGTTRQSTLHYFYLSLSLVAMFAAALGLEQYRLMSEKKNKGEKPVDREDVA